MNTDGLARGKWIEIDPYLSFQAPRFPGVYVMLYDGIAVYVGQSSNLRARISQHNIRPSYGSYYITPWDHIEKLSHKADFTCKIKLSVRYGDWAMWELRLIKKLRPRFNATFVNAKRRAA